MKPVTRSTSGALLMLAIIPFLAGLLACMPVPIGNPERSRIDPDLSGVWAASDEEPVLYHFRPYDKRTWLVVGIELEAGASFEGESLEIETSDDILTAMAAHDIGDAGITASETVAYKAWLTKLGGVQFMTWEPVGGFNSDGSVTPEYWFVFKVVKIDRDNAELYMVDADHDAFEHIIGPDDYDGDDYPGDMRRTWEKALKKAADDETLYLDPIKLRRVPDGLLGKASKLFREVIDFA